MKIKIISAIIFMVLSIAFLVTSGILIENEVINPAGAVVLMVVAVGLVCIALAYATKIGYETDVYECKKCGHIFKPTFRAYVMGAHTITARHLKCPECNETSWCKRRNAKG